MLCGIEKLVLPLSEGSLCSSPGVTMDFSGSSCDCLQTAFGVTWQPNHWLIKCQPCFAMTVRIVKAVVDVEMILHFFSQSASGTCGFLVTAPMRSGRSRRLAPQRLTNRWATHRLVSVGHSYIFRFIRVFGSISYMSLLFIRIKMNKPNRFLFFSFQRMALIRKTTKK